MKSRLPFEPPLLVFPDRAGGFLVFHDPVATFGGPQRDEAEVLASQRGFWVAGGLEYNKAETLGPGWWGVFDQPQVLTRDEVALLADPSPVFVGPLRSCVTQQDYEEAFALVRQALAQGKSYQVNLTFPVEGQAVGVETWSWRSALRLWLDLVAWQGREAVFAALGTSVDPSPIVASASPELFFARQGDVIEARPMKGTAVRHSDPVLDEASRVALAQSEKTRAENLMVTDMLRNDLGRLAVPAGVRVPRLFEIEQYPSVWQMTSTVEATLKPGLGMAGLLEALFPCASITGAPKISTQTVISSAESWTRGWYTGTLGWHCPATQVSRFSVLIRTLVFSDKTPAFRLGVGGGVVWDSTPQGEWDEAWAKTRFLQPVQRAFCLTEAILWEPGSGLFLLEEHEARLTKACLAFGGGLEPGALRAALEAEAARLLDSGLLGPFKLRVLVDPEFRLRVEGEVLVDLPETLTVALATTAFSASTLLWRRYKTTEREVYRAGHLPGFDQTLHFNERGELTESTSMNLVLEIEGRLLTPARSSGLLDGTFREHLLAQGTIEEAVLPVSSLAVARRIWLINSVRRWKPAILSPILQTSEEPLA